MTIRVNERGTFEYKCRLVDEDGELLVPVSLSTLTLTLYDKSTDAIINSRDDQSVLNANGGTLYSTLQTDAEDNEYNFAWNSDPADSPIVTAGSETEVHVALFEWTYGAEAGSHQVYIRVVNLNKRP